LQREGKTGWVFDQEYIHLAPDAAQREWLQGRAALIELSLRPAGDDRVRAQVVALGATMKHRKPGSQSDAELILKAYIADLSGLPAYGVIDACTAFRQKQIGDGWMPDPGDVRKEALLRAAWAHAELADIRAILSARVPPKRETLDHRRRVAAEMRRRVGIAAPSHRLGHPDLATADENAA
jgi:hypothetical protein